MLVLPKPKREYVVHAEAEVSAVTKNPNAGVPRYRNRRGFVPRKPEDHGDGGAFPEVHVAQYPLGMGKKGPGNSSNGQASRVGGALALTTDAQGKVQYDAIVKRSMGGRGSTDLVYARREDTLQRNSTAASNEALREPSGEAAAERARKTQEALDAIIGRRREEARNVKIVDNRAANESVAKPTYINYTPSGAQGQDGRKNRVIRMVEAPTDPLDLPKFKHKKQPRAAAQDFVPILQAPAKKPTAQEQADWKIPPSISSWKNSHGFTISLDKRLAADGRGLEQTPVNDKFAKFSEALYIAENQARAEVEARNTEKQFLLKKAKEQREHELRDLASAARLERDTELRSSEQPESYGQTIAPATTSSSSASSSSKISSASTPVEPASGGNLTSREISGGNARPMPPARRRARSGSAASTGSSSSEGSAASSKTSTSSHSSHSTLSSGERAARRRNRRRRRMSESSDDKEDEDDRKVERDRIRRERKRERERDLRLEAAGKKSKLSRDLERDVSEKIALGMAVPKSAVMAGDAQFDSRLFNQSSGIGSGLGGEDDDNVYSKPLFNRDMDKIYRPRQSATSKYGSADKQLEELSNTERFRPSRGFAGAEESAGTRSGPVQFEKASADPFSALASGEARQPGQRMDDALGRRPGQGMMSMQSGGGDKRSAQELLSGSSRRKIAFERGSSDT